MHKKPLFYAVVVVLLLGGWACFNITDYCVNHYSKFSDCGEIGDAIGGTVTPLVTFIALIIATFAFVVQFLALIEQRKQIAKEHIENKFYNMLDVYNRNCDNLVAGTLKGKMAAKELAGEFYYTFSVISSIYEGTFKNYINDTDIKPVILGDINKLIERLNADIEEKNLFLLKVSYGLFYDGLLYTYPYHNNERGGYYLVEQIKRRLKDFVYYNEDRDYSSFLKDDSEFPNSYSYSFKYPLLGGHNESLGCYYRQLYQIVKFVSDVGDDLFSEDDKYNHIKVLRAQMSDYEQFLLFYNGLSDYGEAWNKKTIFKKGKKSYSMGYIARYKLIKNIPSNIVWRSINPIDYYKHENKIYSDLQTPFFERIQLIQVSDSTNTLN